MKKSNGYGLFLFLTAVMAVVILFWQEISAWGRRYHVVRREREEN